MMWKVLLLLACVAGSAVVYCDDSFDDDCTDTDSSFIDDESSYSSSSSSLSSSISQTSQSSSSKDLTSSSVRSASLSSMSSSSSSQSSSTIISKHVKSQDTDDSEDLSDSDNSETVDVGEAAESDSDSLENSSPQECSGTFHGKVPRPTPTYKCGPNEVFSNCTNGGCDARYCSQAGKPVPCVKLDPKSCKKGCVCAPGYLRTAKGKCVPRNKCNEGCGNDPNSHPGCGINCGRTCATYKQKNVACILVCYDNGCDCNEGWVYDSNVKKCVKPTDCTPTCGLNEQYSPCTNGGCGHRNCSQIGKPQICIDRTPESCTKGCICAEGYLRANNGTCIPEKQCPANGCGDDLNAEPGCGYHCGNTCSTYKVKRPTCPRIPCKRDGCECKNGFVYDTNVKKCVRPAECTPICGLHEQFSSCTNGGRGYRNCSQIGQPQICIKRTPESCIKGCVCAEGYLRADNGTCIPQDQCPAPGCGGDPNAQRGCGYNCRKKCSDYKSKSRFLCPRIQCQPDKCDCKDGYVLDENLKKCVRPEKCTPVCGYNEKYTSCINGGCGHRNCSQLGQPILCIDPIPGACKPGCLCADGYLRDANGKCVPQKECPNAKGCNGDPKAKPGCGVNCGKTCDTYKVKNPVCPRICRVDGCDCVDGYVYDKYVQKCVKPEKCTPTCNKPNEVYVKCLNTCPLQRCDVDPRVIRCAAPPKPGDPDCKPGCACEDGYARNATGSCVLREQCEQPLKCNYEDNETYVSCPAPCPGDSCDVNPALVLCLPGPQYGDPQCKPACRCLDGYARNADNKCVPRDQCPPKTDDQCPGQNESYDTCISGCSNQTCDSIGKIYNCPIQPAVCRTGCRCNPGFWRNASNVCVSESECPTPPCPEGELYSRCPTVPCEGDYCQKTRDSPTRCPVGIVCDKARCVCGFGSRRDHKTGKCIQTQDCPPFKCNGPNEEYQACPGGDCPGDNCSDYGKECPVSPFRIGIRVPCQPECKCKKGFYRNDNGICVKPSQCAPLDDQCPGKNEIYDTCISGCSNQTCDSIGKIYHCPIQPAVCRTGCRCKPGFWRNAANVCVPESECPSPPCPEGEIYNRCPTVPCDGDNCPKDRNSPQTCPVGIVCSNPRCTCGPLDKRDRKTKKCIKAYTCPPFKCDGPNEKYDACSSSCPGEKCSDYVNGRKCPPFRIGVVVPCRPACRCNKGYYRNSNGTCVLANQCGPVDTTTFTPVIVDTTTTEKPTNDSGDNEALAKLKTGVTIFNGKFIYDCMKGNKGKNLITSPYSVITPLVQMLMFASGNTLKQLTTAINVESKEQIRSAYPALVDSLAGQTSVNFSTAAIVYSDIKYPLSDAFKKISVDVIRAGAQELEFSKNVEAAKTINTWVESKTNNLIHDLIQSSDLSELTRLVLVNAIYFKGQWKYSFNKNITIKNADFYLSDGTTKKTSLMYQERRFNYGEVPELDCKVLQMFYKGDNFSMVIVLPNQKDGILPVAEKLQLQPNFDKVMNSMRSQLVKVYVPPFKIETTTDLSDILKQMGVTDIFNPKNSGLSGMLKTPEDIYVSKAIQKAFIEVNEEGTEAAAANGVIVSTRAIPLPPPEPIVFRADRPFLFYIRLQDTTLFSGVKSDI